MHCKNIVLICSHDLPEITLNNTSPAIWKWFAHTDFNLTHCLTTARLPVDLSLVLIYLTNKLQLTFIFILIFILAILTTVWTYYKSFILQFIGLCVKKATEWYEKPRSLWKCLEYSSIFRHFFFFTYCLTITQTSATWLGASQLGQTW